MDLHCLLSVLNMIFLPVRQSSVFSGAGKFCLAHGLRQLSRDIVTLEF